MSVSHLTGPGDVLGERYTLRKQAWTSALGPVWLARDSVLDRQVFVQTLTPRLAADGQAKRRFQKAATRVAQVTHPAVLQVFDIGDDPPFVVFEHAGGGRLSDRLDAGRLTEGEAARTALALARGLEALHATGESHGALSASSVLFDEEGRAKILANGAHVAARKATEKEQSAAYRTPEHDASPQDSDRYALAALTHHMVTGGPPGESTRKRPPGFDELLARALSATPAARPSLSEFIAALAPFARVAPTEARPPRFANSGSDFRWLGAAALIIVGAVVAAVLGFRIAHDVAARSGTKSKPSTSAPPSHQITVSSVDDFDPPPGGSGSEHPAEVGRAIDGDPLTQWETEGYGRATYGTKSGVGLLFDLGSVTDVRHIKVQTSRAGWQAEIRVSETRGSTAGVYRVATTFTAGSDTTVAVPAGTRARYVVVWITNLVDDGSGSDHPFRASVAEVAFFAS